MTKPITINIDFDGTCVTHEYPRIAKDIGASKVLKELTNNGHKLILFTMRSNSKQSEDNFNTFNGLDEAVNWFKENDIPLYGIQTNPTQLTWTTSPKSYAKLMIDDSALGTPLNYDETISDKPFVNWDEVRKLLKNYKLIN